MLVGTAQSMLPPFLVGFPHIPWDYRYPHASAGLQAEHDARLLHVRILLLEISSRAMRVEQNWNGDIYFQVHVGANLPTTLLGPWKWRSLKGRGVNVEGPSGVGFLGRGRFPPHHLGRLGEQCKLPSRVQGKAPATWRVRTSFSISYG